MISHTQIKHYNRNVRQWVAKVPVGVIGGYHGGNLGDMALGEAVRQVLSLRGIRSGLQTVYNLNRWPKAPFAIIGGGAVGYTISLSQVARRYQACYNKVGAIGVDFNEQNYPDHCLDLIREAAFVSCRSKAQAKRLAAISGRKEICHHPDIAFSLFTEFCTQQREIVKDNKRKKLLVNVVPLYASIRKGVLYPLAEYSSERPELYASFSLMHSSYKKAIRSVVNEALQAGYEIETIPFTPSDEAYGHILLEGLPVKHTAYHSNSFRMLTKIATADWVVATRLHATIFALKLGVRLTPIAYSTKNEQLLEELGIERLNFLTTDDLCKGNYHILQPIKVESAKIKIWETNSEKAINKCIDTLEINKKR